MDREEFRKFWLPHSAQFYRIAYHILENQEDAEDAVQDLFVRLWNTPSLVEKAEKPLAYAMMMLRNMCIDRVRKSTAQRHESFDDDLGIIDEDTSADRNIETSETIRKLADAMSGLTAGQKRIMKLRLATGLGYSEIAKKTGIPESSLRVMLCKARKQLKNSFEKI